LNATVTSEAQTFFGGVALPDFAAAVASGSGTYRGRTENIYEEHVPKPSEIFLIVEFQITGVRRTLQLTPEDVVVSDGRGGLHKTIACQFLQDKKWYPFDFMTISPENAKEKQVIVSGFSTIEIQAKYRWKYERWIFTLPADAVEGATIALQGKSYPLTLNK